MNRAAQKPVLHGPSLVPAWVPFVYALALTYEIATHANLRWYMYRRITVLALVAIGAIVVFLAGAAQRAELGADGIGIRWLLWRRTIDYSDIRRATPEGRKKVTIVTQAGRRLVLSAGFLDEAAARDVLDRFWKSLASGAQEGSRGIEREMLARSGRTVEQWRRALRELGGPGSYRNAQLSHDRLLTLAENAGTPAEIRIAAIVALSAGDLDPLARDRLRNAAAVTVDPVLREALDALGTPGAGLAEAECDHLLGAVPRA